MSTSNDSTPTFLPSTAEIYKDLTDNITSTADSRKQVITKITEIKGQLADIEEITESMLYTKALTRLTHPYTTAAVCYIQDDIDERLEEGRMFTKLLTEEMEQLKKREEALAEEEETLRGRAQKLVLTESLQ